MADLTQRAASPVCNGRLPNDFGMRKIHLRRWRLDERYWKTVGNSEE